MGLCVAFFLMAVAGGVQAAVVNWGMMPLAIAEGEAWRLLTSAFVHASIVHLGFNMLVLYLLGPSLEMILGHVWFLVLYLLSALGGTTMSYLLLSPAGVSVGSSGAIFGLMGALVVAGRRFRFDVRQVVILLAINLVIGLALGSFIDWRAHFGGLLVGTATAAVIAYAAGRHKDWYRAAGCLLIALALTSVVAWRTSALGVEPVVPPGRVSMKGV